MISNKIGLFELDTINLGQGTKDILQRAIERIDSQEKIAHEDNSFKEKSKIVSCPVDPILKAISGYDMIISITQGQINSHFKQHIRESQLNIEDNLGYIKANMNPPSISLSVPESQDYLILKLSLESGTYVYGEKIEFIDNWTIAFKIKIGFEALPQSDFKHNGTNGQLPDSIIDGINKGTITVYHLFLDFENSDLNKIDADLSQIPNHKLINDGNLIQLLGLFLKSKKGSKNSENPFKIGYFAITKDTQQTRDLMPIIRPTYCKYSLYKSRLNEDLNRINILFMMDDHEPPIDYHFSDELDCYKNGMIIISKRIFERKLLEAIILPEFLRSIQNQFSSNSKYTILREVEDCLDYENLDCNGWVKSNGIYSCKLEKRSALVNNHFFYGYPIKVPLKDKDGCTALDPRHFQGTGPRFPQREDPRSFQGTDPRFPQRDDPRSFQGQEMGDQSYIEISQPITITEIMSNTEINCLMNTDLNQNYKNNFCQTQIKFFKPNGTIKICLSKSYEITCDLVSLKGVKYLNSNQAELDFEIKLITGQGISLDISSEQPRFKHDSKIINNPIEGADQYDDWMKILQPGYINLFLAADWLWIEQIHVPIKEKLDQKYNSKILQEGFSDIWNKIMLRSIFYLPATEIFFSKDPQFDQGGNLWVELNYKG